MLLRKKKIISFMDEVGGELSFGNLCSSIEFFFLVCEDIQIQLQHPSFLKPSERNCGWHKRYVCHSIFLHDPVKIHEEYGWR